MNVYLHLGRNLWGPIIQRMKQSGQWENVVWDHTSRRGAHPDHCEVNCKSLQHRHYPVKSSIYDEVYKQAFQFMNMYSRNNRYDQSQYSLKTFHDQLNIFNIQISYYARTLEENCIDLVIFNRAPHSGADWVLYNLSKALGLQTLILQKNGFFPGRFFHVFEQDDFGTFNTSRVLAEKEPFKTPRRFERAPAGKNSRDAKPTLRQRVRKTPVGRMLAELKNEQNFGEALFHYVLEKRFRRYEARYSRSDVDLDRDFVYFPLHFQPEQNTTAWGGRYDDQLLAIEELAPCLPRDWVIYVKENPLQEGYSRGKWFYERLLGIPNVEFISRNLDTYTLLEKSRFAATVTGTVGWESICGGKPILVFGDGCWYKSLPGVVKFHPEFSVDEVLDVKFEHEELEDAVSGLLTKCGFGEVYKRAGLRIENSIEEGETNCDQIFKSLSRILAD